MIDYLGLENIVIFMAVVVAWLAYSIDRFSKRVNMHLDKLQTRVDELEERLGIKEPFDLDPLGFSRENNNSSNEEGK